MRYATSYLPCRHLHFRRTDSVRQMSYDAEFSPESCNTTYNAMTIGVSSPFVDDGFAWLTTGEIPKGGVGFHTVYEFAEANNLTFIGGYHQTIAASGGWVQVHFRFYFSVSLLQSDHWYRVVATVSSPQSMVWAQTACYNSKSSLPTANFVSLMNVRTKICSGAFLCGG